MNSLSKFTVASEIGKIEKNHSFYGKLIILVFSRTGFFSYLEGSHFEITEKNLFA